jgi:arginine N-succinyltransferase
MKPTDFRLRPVAAADLPALERIAQASAFGINSLPDERAKLVLRIERSLQAFASQDLASGEEAYLFVLEDLASGEVVGTSGIAASAGFRDRFYSYRNEFVVQEAPLLGVSQRMHTLHLCHDLTGCTLLTSFFIEPDYEATLAPQLLSRARLLFIHAHADRFSERVAAENPGLADAQGNSPFWDAVGRRFFNMDYPSAERLAGGRARSFIADLMPKSAIYVPLLPERAQWAIGQLHPVGELPFSILQDEGFETDTYVDVFDAGPTVDARLPVLHSVRQSRAVRVGAGQVPPGQSGLAQPPLAWHLLVRTPREGFAAVLAQLPAQASELPSEHEAVQRLGAQAGDILLASALPEHLQALVSAEKEHT